MQDFKIAKGIFSLFLNSHWIPLGKLKSKCSNPVRTSDPLRTKCRFFLSLTSRFMVV